ncbi:MAG: accessory factor UbiK family protein [Burkholderiales bacterium]|nr:accessory factor UbiK family protein [Burkholderiales bacterium]
MEPPLVKELSERIREAISRSPAADLEKNLRALLAAAFSRLDLVTREEFDVQREVLARARAKLEELEARLAAIERGQETKDSSSSEKGPADS